MTNDQAPNPVQHMQCAALIAKVVISEDGKFTKSEIELANGPTHDRTSQPLYRA